jgi:iron(III) transport system substrate-binding protein
LSDSAAFFRLGTMVATPLRKSSTGGEIMGVLGRALSAVISVVLLTGGAWGAEKVVVYSPFKNELMGKLGEAFKAETGIELQNLVISSGEIFSRIKVERHRPQADIWLSVRALFLKQAGEEGLIEPYLSPRAKEIYPPFFYGGPFQITGVGMYPLVFFYNPAALEKAKLAPPKSYDDLLDSKLKGQIVMPHPATSGTAYTLLTTVLQAYGEEKGWAYLEKLAANVAQFTRSGRAPHKMVATGEYPVGIGFWDDAYILAKQGYPIKTVFPLPIYAEPYCMAIVKNSPNPTGARKFFDFMLGKKAQEILVQNGDYSVRADVEPPAGALSLLTIERGKLKDDYVWAAKEKKAILARFTTVLEQKGVKGPTK